MTEPYVHNEDTIVHGSLTVDSGINVGTVNAGLYPLSTYVAGKILETTMINLKPWGTTAPFCTGAEWYMAVNHSIDGNAGPFPAAFVTDTARTSNDEPTFHNYEDNVGVFGSYVYSGVLGNEPQATFVGGVVMQASQPTAHESGKLGTRLLLAYTPKDTSDAVVGAMIDDDGTFAVDKTFRHVGNNGGKVGFFGANPVDRPKVDSGADFNDDKLNCVITALRRLGLVEDLNQPPPDACFEGEGEGETASE